MKPNPAAARQVLQNAQQAVQRHDRAGARRWAEMAAALDPEMEEPWLILAAVSSPRSSIEYLERALKINPSSERARKGMHWAIQRLRKEEGQKRSPTQPLPKPGGQLATEAPVQESIPIPSGPGQLGDTAPVKARSPQDPEVQPVEPRKAKGHQSFLLLLALIVCLTIAWAVWPGNASPALAFLRRPQSTPSLPGAAADIAKPTYTPTFTATFTPTPTFTSTPTSTPTDTPTPTPTPTDTPLPTDTPPPYEPPQPDWGADADNPCSGGVNERWINVNLSTQSLYACEYGTTVAGFIVSTGTSRYPTVTGSYHIYIKLRYTRMTGPGYNLPNVPYTMYFYKGYGIHGTYWHNNFGVPMSHGCINMRTSDAGWLYSWASEGTLVYIHY